jgi:xanthine dehydrogenase iron-sulfur cluster and FAD-binding subunit A
MNGSNTRFYKRDEGDGLYRRSLYTFWKRSAPPASMEIFNAPTREMCTVRRERTNTPLQALVTMNDVQFVEAARVLAERSMQTAAGFDARLDFITTRVLARRLGARERAIARRSFDDFARYYAAHPEDAAKLLAGGERKPDPALPRAEYAALAMLTNQVMNLDEVLNK